MARPASPEMLSDPDEAEESRPALLLVAAPARACGADLHRLLVRATWLGAAER